MSPGILPSSRLSAFSALLDVPLGAGDLCRGGIQELLGLVHVQPRGGAPVVTQLDEFEIVRGDIARAARDIEFQIRLAQSEVPAGDVADQRHDDTAPAFFGRQILRPSRFLQTAHPAPEVQFPGERRPRLRVADIERGARRHPRIGSDRRWPRGRELPLDAQQRELSGLLIRNWARASSTRSEAMPRSKLCSRAVVTSCLSVSSWNRSDHFVSASDAAVPLGGRASKLTRRRNRRPLVVRPDGTARRE